MRNRTMEGDAWQGFRPHRRERPRANLGTLILLVAFMAGIGAILGGACLFLLINWEFVWGSGRMARMAWEQTTVAFAAAAGIGAAVAAIGTIAILKSKERAATTREPTGGP